MVVVVMVVAVIVVVVAAVRVGVLAIVLEIFDVVIAELQPLHVLSHLLSTLPHKPCVKILWH